MRRTLVRARRALVYSAVLASTMVDGQQRHFVQETLALARELPGRLEQPLPAALQALTPPAQPQFLDPNTMRQIVDALTAFGAGRPLGICLRRSLLRYYFLRRAGLPLVIHFGARRLGDEIGGHAWLTLEGQPYHESPDHTRVHTLMWSYPSGAGR
ncbi:MAG TPA: lasso peptide biosynthesis B2 protein [Anaerolineae bacterium]|nr:lasso peptide biosynthesis B2 protein [Anaerolineae bacterium]